MKIRLIHHEAAKPDSQHTGLYATCNTLPLIARVLLSLLFIGSGINKILHPLATQDYMATYGMPLTGLFLVAAVIVELGGGLSLLLRYYAPIGALILAVFLILASLIFHTQLSDPLQQIMLMKNLAILGGLLMVLQHGPGNVVLRLARQR